MTKILMQQVLGNDWQQLPEAIQRHYRLGDGEESRLAGTMQIDYPAYLFPLIWLIHLFGGLLLWRAPAAYAEVDKTADAAGLIWRRRLDYPDGRSDCFNSRMAYVADRELAEYIGFGFVLRLRVSVENGDLLYRSLGHFWQCGSWVVPIPDWLLLGSTTIRECALAADRFYLDFEIRHPWWGLSYQYRGEFAYR
ncbi:DUF4166 domain-containing protein [Methylomonas sp. DH-1]|uniref:DUF4166 domain-containing protein n=1 Tax=Methylomonas sp. (strain DH-1) TaxID=1727196 RepID=UPI0007C8B62A|nr:DUF4166 domain-containing protein [Methylomonas sp. DH-1]ANE57390.1 hypothetical protein AYM39_20890 [Methylomonas sp. DH-1]